MKKNQLVEMIRAIVAEEVRKQLPKVVSEMYLRNIVSEALGSRSDVKKEVHSHPNDFASVFERELASRRDDYVPEPMDNSDEGIYDDGGPIRRKNESIRAKILAKENPLLGHMFEGVVPTDARESIGARPSAPLIGPLAVDETGDVRQMDPRMYGEFFKKMSGQKKGLIQQTPEALERELQLKRAKLDEQVVDTTRK